MFAPDGSDANLGHAYYFLEDVYPRMTGRRPLKTPSFIQAMFLVDEPIRPAAEDIMHQFVGGPQHLEQQQDDQQQAAAEYAGDQAVQPQGAAPPSADVRGDGRPHED